MFSIRLVISWFGHFMYMERLIVVFDVMSHALPHNTEKFQSGLRLTFYVIWVVEFLIDFLIRFEGFFPATLVSLPFNDQHNNVGWLSWRSLGPNNPISLDAKFKLCGIKPNETNIKQSQSGKGHRNAFTLSCINEEFRNEEMKNGPFYYTVLY